MPHTLIASNPTFQRKVEGNYYRLNVAEFFSDTVQGEGISAGVPSTFLRLQGCTLDCIWCDTQEVWRYGNPYSLGELLNMAEDIELHKRWKDGQHLILTGGSPLKQQGPLCEFLKLIERRHGFIPYVEVENECVLRITPEFAELVSQWNNSPKLENSGMKKRARLKPEILAHTSKMTNAWFKFVVASEQDWNEIQNDFLNTNLIRKDQIILMPCGEDQKALSATRELAADLAVKHGVRMTDRLHVTIWNKKTGV